MTYIPRKTAAELQLMSGGALLVRYLELVRRHERMPLAGWLRRAVDETGDELHRRMLVGALSEALCGLLSHHRGPWRESTPCGCELPSIEEGGWGQHVAEGVPSPGLAGSS